MSLVHESMREGLQILGEKPSVIVCHMMWNAETELSGFSSKRLMESFNQLPSV